MAQDKKTPYRRPIQIAVYAPPTLYNLVAREAERRRRKLGPTVMEILWAYFERKHMEEGINVGTATRTRKAS